MKYIYILGLFFLILICILYNHTIKEGVRNLNRRELDASKNSIIKQKIESYEKVGDDFFGDVTVSEEKRPSDYHIKQEKCNELKICNQLNQDDYEDCGYCLADDMDLSKPYSFHYGNKGGAYSVNSNCHHGKDKYTGRGGEQKRNVEWVAPNSNKINGRGTSKKCTELKTKHTCEKQKQCNFMKGVESNIDKEANCGWCLDKTNDAGGNSYVRNLSNDPNDLKKIKANYVERIDNQMVFTSTNRENKHPKNVGGISCTPTKTLKEAEDYCNVSKDCGGFWRYAKGSKGDNKAAGLRTCYKKVVKQKDWWKNNFHHMRGGWKGAYHEKVYKSGIKKYYYCSNNEGRNEGEKEKDDDVSDGKCKSSQIEKEDWNTIDFPKFKAKAGTCKKDLIKQSDCRLFLKESCMKKSYNEETGQEEEGPFNKDNTLCIKDLWEDIGFTGNFEKFKNEIYVTEDGEEKDTEIRDIMNIWKGANNFGEIQTSMINLVKDKIHSNDFYTAKKWNKILLNKNVCSEAFIDSELKPNTETECVNPCYQYQLEGTEWEKTPKECQVKIFERHGGKENGLVHPINRSGKIPSVLQFFGGSNIRERFTTRDISNVSIINNKENPGKYISLNNESLSNKSIEKISSIYENIKKNISNDVSFEKNYRASLQLNGEAPSELENKLCWVEFVKMMRTYPGTKIGDTYQDITINNEMKNKLGNIHIRDNNEKSYKIIEAYLKVVEGNTNNWILKKKTYEDPGFDFRPWNKVLNEYWEEDINWIEFMHLMMKQENVRLHLAYGMYDDENKEKIEINERSPFYNLINGNACTYTKNMFLLKFNVTNLGSGATLYIKNNNYQQKEELSMGENEILLHPHLYNRKTIELIPLVKSSLTIRNAKLIRIRDKKYSYVLKDYNKTSSCDNVWNYCYWDNLTFFLDNEATNNTSFNQIESTPKLKYLLKRHRTHIDFTKFFALIENNDFINLRYKSLDPETLKGKTDIKDETKEHENTINRHLTSKEPRKDTNYMLNITAGDQNWGWRTSKIELEGGNSNTTIGIGGPYDPIKGHGIYYKKKMGDFFGTKSRNNTTYIKKDVTNHVVKKNKNGSKVKMDLKYYTGYGGHETYIDKAKLSVNNTPDNKTKNINLLTGIHGNRIKVKGSIQGRRKIPEYLKWIQISNGRPIIDNSELYEYTVTGKGADQGSGHSSSEIIGSDLSNERKKSQLFEWRNKVSNNNRPLDERWEDINLSGKINQHNTDHKIKIEKYTSQNPGHETYMKNLKLNITKNKINLLSPISIGKNIQIHGNTSKDLNQSPIIPLWEGFQNNEKSGNIITDKLNNIKNYFFPEKEGYWNYIFNPPILKNGAQISFIGKDQGWGNDCNAHLSINGKKSPKFGHNWKLYKINFDEKINKTNNTMDVKLHKYGYSGCEVHVKNAKIQIKNPSNINTQRSTKTYDIGNKSVTNRSGGRTIFEIGEVVA